jgi:hypothetical protein
MCSSNIGVSVKIVHSEIALNPKRKRRETNHYSPRTYDGGKDPIEQSRMDIR